MSDRKPPRRRRTREVPVENNLPSLPARRVRVGASKAAVRGEKPPQHGSEGKKRSSKVAGSVLKNAAQTPPPKRVALIAATLLLVGGIVYVVFADRGFFVRMAYKTRVAIAKATVPTGPRSSQTCQNFVKYFAKLDPGPSISGSSKSTGKAMDFGLIQYTSQPAYFDYVLPKYNFRPHPNPELAGHPRASVGWNADLIAFRSFGQMLVHGTGGQGVWSYLTQFKNFGMLPKSLEFSSISIEEQSHDVARWKLVGDAGDARVEAIVYPTPGQSQISMVIYPANKSRPQAADAILDGLVFHKDVVEASYKDRIERSPAARQRPFMPKDVGEKKSNFDIRLRLSVEGGLKGSKLLKLEGQRNSGGGYMPPE